MRRVSLIRAAGGLFVALLAAGASAESTATERFDADVASSRVTVEGTSTLHDWHVEGRQLGGYVLVQDHELAALWANSGASLHELTPRVRVDIPVTSLTSGKRGMDENMHAALKATTHPTITYRLESATVTAHQPGRAEDASGSVTLETAGILMVAGVERTVDIPMHVRRLSNGRLEVSGETTLRMTDFGIEPPKAMFGTIRSGDTIHVHWTWVLAHGPVDRGDAQ